MAPDDRLLLTFHNERSEPLDIGLEPTGNVLHLDPGDTCDLLSEGGPRVDIHVTDHVVLWGVDDPHYKSGIASSRLSVGSVRELNEYFVARQERLFADSTGCNLFREVDGLQHAVGIIWAVSPGLVELHAGLPFTAPAEREGQLALAITRLNSSVKASGFRMLPAVNGHLHFTYTNYLFLDEGRIGTTVLESALSNVLNHASKFGPQLQRVAKGGTVD